MHYLNNSYELLTGGLYSGNSSWGKTHSEIDNCFKIYQLTKGEIYITETESEYKLEAGKTYLVNGFRLHRQFCKYSFSTHWLHFIPKNLVWYLWLQSLPCVVEIHERCSERTLSDLIQVIQSESVTSLVEYAKASLRLQILIGKVINDVCERFPMNKNKLESMELRIEPAILYINNHYKEAIKLEYLAQLCLMSVPYFHKIFKKTVKITPANYQLVLKMNDALQQLTDPKISIKEIALDLGFTDNAHFCKTFKHHYGITPSAYKEQRKNTIL